MIQGVVGDIKKAVYMPCYTGAKSKEELIELCFEKASVLSQYLNEKTYIVGSELCYVDFQIFEVVSFMSFVTEWKLYEMYPSLEDYMFRLGNLPNVKEFLASDPSLQQPFNMRFAKIVNWPDVAQLSFNA